MTSMLAPRHCLPKTLSIREPAPPSAASTAPALTLLLALPPLRRGVGNQLFQKARAPRPALTQNAERNTPCAGSVPA